MRKYILLFTLVLSVTIAFGQDSMTPEKFQELVTTSGDKSPLQPRLSAIPLWTNFTVNIELKYETGTNFTEEVTGTTKTIGGKYIVYTFQSKYYHRPVSSILTFDAKASAIKGYGLYSDLHGTNFLTEGTIIYDYEKRIYAASSAYGEGYKEITLGSYSDTECSDRTLVFKNGVLFMTREVKARVADSGK